MRGALAAVLVIQFASAAVSAEARRWVHVENRSVRTTSIAFIGDERLTALVTDSAGNAWVGTSSDAGGRVVRIERGTGLAVQVDRGAPVSSVAVDDGGTACYGGYVTSTVTCVLRGGSKWRVALPERSDSVDVASLRGETYIFASSSGTLYRLRQRRAVRVARVTPTRWMLAGETALAFVTPRKTAMELYTPERGVERRTARMPLGLSPYGATRGPDVIVSEYPARALRVVPANAPARTVMTGGRPERVTCRGSHCWYSAAGFGGLLDIGAWSAGEPHEYIPPARLSPGALVAENRQGDLVLADPVLKAVIFLRRSPQ
jgi:hypothetical protein